MEVKSIAIGAKVVIESEKQLHAAWYKNDDPIAYRWYLDGSPEFVQDYGQSEKSWLAAKSQVPEGFVLVPRVITDEWMSIYIDPAVNNYCKEFEGLPFSVKDEDLPSVQEDFRRPIRNAHKQLMQVIEAQERGHD